jgi:hypothetical protein
MGTVVSAPGAGVIGVSVNGALMTLPHCRAYIPAVNDTVLIVMQGSRRIVLDAIVNPVDPVAPRAIAPAPSQPIPPPAVIAAPPKTGTVAPAPPKTVITGTQTFTAKSTGDYRGGQWRTDSSQPHQGDYGGWGVNTGCWFYGTGIHTALSGATVTSAQIYLTRVSGGVFAAVQPTVYTLSNASRPAGAPSKQGGGTNLGSIAVNTSKWVSFPASWAQRFVDGTAHGLACFISGSDPYIVFGSLSDNRSSGALKIAYKR